VPAQLPQSSLRRLPLEPDAAGLDGMTTYMSLADQLDDPALGEEIFALASEIYPICRSITGPGVRDTLDVVGRHIDLEVHEVPTGTRVFDWTVPNEWIVRDAYIKDETGRKVVDFHDCNLHVLGYSQAVHARIALDELKKHVFTLPDQPGLIPYRTSYYADRWGFCMSHDRLCSLPDGLYEVLIDAAHIDGSLTYGEYLHRGESEDEFLLSAHVCHPSLANDNCSGVALLTHLAERLVRLKTRYSYRFLFAPGTIGAITWLARNEHGAKRIRYGLVVAGVGDAGGPTYKRSRSGEALIDRAMAHVLRHAAPASTVLDFSPYGYDERQFCSPGFNLPVGLFQRSPFGSFPEYHTSADNLDFIAPQHLAASYRVIAAAIEIAETDARPRSRLPKCEPQLGRRGLYTSLGGDHADPARNMALLWVLNLADGRTSLLDIAERADLPFTVVADAADRLRRHGLLTESGAED
jgi:aminopeptidase-like protein